MLSSAQSTTNEYAVNRVLHNNVIRLLLLVLTILSQILKPMSHTYNITGRHSKRLILYLHFVLEDSSECLAINLKKD